MGGYRKIKRLGLPGGANEIIVDEMGQWSNPGQPTRIESNQITMQGVPYPVWALPNVGSPTLMYPNQDYSFPGAEYVDELPLAQMNMNLDVPAPNMYTPEAESTGVANQIIQPIYEKKKRDPLTMEQLALIQKNYAELQSNPYAVTESTGKQKSVFSLSDEDQFRLYDKIMQKQNLRKGIKTPKVGYVNTGNMGVPVLKGQTYDFTKTPEENAAKTQVEYKHAKAKEEFDKRMIESKLTREGMTGSLDYDLADQADRDEYFDNQEKLKKAQKEYLEAKADGVLSEMDYKAKTYLGDIIPGALGGLLKSARDIGMGPLSAMNYLEGNPYYDNLKEAGLLPGNTYFDNILNKSEIFNPTYAPSLVKDMGALDPKTMELALGVAATLGTGAPAVTGARSANFARAATTPRNILRSPRTSGIQTIEKLPLGFDPKKYAQDIAKRKANIATYGEDPFIIRSIRPESQREAILNSFLGPEQWAKDLQKRTTHFDRFGNVIPQELKPSIKNIDDNPSVFGIEDFSSKYPWEKWNPETVKDKAIMDELLELERTTNIPKLNEYVNVKQLPEGYSLPEGYIAEASPIEIRNAFAREKGIDPKDVAEMQYLMGLTKGYKEFSKDGLWPSFHGSKKGSLKKLDVSENEKSKYNKGLYQTDDYPEAYDIAGMRIPGSTAKVHHLVQPKQDVLDLTGKVLDESGRTLSLPEIEYAITRYTDPNILPTKQAAYEKFAENYNKKVDELFDWEKEKALDAYPTKETIPSWMLNSKGEIPSSVAWPARRDMQGNPLITWTKSNDEAIVKDLLGNKGTFDPNVKDIYGAESFRDSIKKQAQDFKGALEAKKVASNWEGIFTPKMEERLRGLNMTTADIRKMKNKPPAVEIKSGHKHGSSYETPSKEYPNGLIIIDPAHIARMKDSYGMTTEAMVKHEIRHAFQEHMAFIEYEKSVNKGLGEYKKARDQQIKDIKAFEESPAGKEYLKKYEDWASEKAALMNGNYTNAQLKLLDAREPVAPKVYNPIKPDDFFPNVPKPADRITDIDESLQMLASKDFSDKTAAAFDKNLIRLGYSLDDIKAHEAFAKRNYEYFKRPREAYPHLVEMRQAMKEVGTIKSVDDKISRKQLKDFILNNPKNRIASFTYPTKEALNLLFKDINRAPIIVGALGLSGAGAALSEKREGGDVKYGPKSDAEIASMFSRKPSSQQRMFSKYGFMHPNTEEGNLIIGSGLNILPIGAQFNATGIIPFNSDPVFKGVGSVGVRKQLGDFNVGFNLEKPFLKHPVTGESMKAPLTPRIGLNYTFQEGGESDELPSYQYTGEVLGYIPPTAETTAYSETTDYSPRIIPINQDEQDVIDLIKRESRPEVLSTRLSDSMGQLTDTGSKARRNLAKIMAAQEIQEKELELQREFEEDLNTKSFDRPNVERQAYSLISQKAKREQALAKLEAEKKLENERGAAAYKAIEPYMVLRNDIPALQKKLKGDGFNLGKYGKNQDGIDGKWGPKTERAYNQALKNKALNPSIIDEYLFKYRTLGPQQEVKSIQRDLINKGYLAAGEDDGKFGNDTADAILAYNNSFKPSPEDVKADIINLKLPETNWAITSPSEVSSKNPSGKVYDCAKGVCRMLELNNVESQALGVKYVDAWGVFKNMEEAGNSIEIFNIYKNPETWRDLSIDQLTNKTVKEIKKNYKDIKDPSNYKAGDIVGMYFPDSPNHGKTNYSVIDPGGYRDDQKATKQLTNTRNTHVGLVSHVIDGMPYISHNIHGKVHVTPLSDIRVGFGTVPVWVRRPAMKANALPTYKPDAKSHGFEDMSKPTDNYLVTTIVDNLEKKAETQFSKAEKDNLNKKVQRVMIGSTQIPKDIGIDLSNAEKQWLQAASLGILGVESRVGTRSISGGTAKGAAKDVVHWWRNTPEGEKSKGIGKIKFDLAVDKFAREYFNVSSSSDLNDANKAIDVTIYNLAKRYESLKAYAEQFPELELQPEDIKNLAILGHNEGYRSQNQTRFGRRKSDEEYNPKTAKEEIHSMRMLYNMGTKVKDISATDYKHIPEDIPVVPGMIDSGDLREALYKLDQDDGAETYISKAKRYMYDVYGDLVPGIQGREYDPYTRKFIDGTSGDTYDFTVAPDEQASYVKRYGGSIDKSLMLQYKNHMEGLVDNQRAYDKVNRIFYNDAKANNMSIPNYVMTHVIR